MSLLPVDPLPDESPTAGLTPDDYRCWSADLSYADGFAMLAAAVMAGYVAIAQWSPAGSRTAPHAEPSAVAPAGN